MQPQHHVNHPCSLQCIEKKNSVKEWSGATGKQKKRKLLSNWYNQGSDLDAWVHLQPVPFAHGSCLSQLHVKTAW